MSVIMSRGARVDGSRAVPRGFRIWLSRFQKRGTSQDEAQAILEDIFLESSVMLNAVSCSPRSPGGSRVIENVLVRRQIFDPGFRDLASSALAADRGPKSTAGQSIASRPLHDKISSSAWL